MPRSLALFTIIALLLVAVAWSEESTFTDAESLEAAELEVAALFTPREEHNTIILLGEEMIREGDLMGALQLYGEAVENQRDRNEASFLPVLAQFSRLLYETRSCLVGMKGRKAIEDYDAEVDHPLIAYYLFRCMAEDQKTDRGTKRVQLDKTMKFSMSSLPGAIWQKSMFLKEESSQFAMYRVIYELPASTADDCEEKNQNYFSFF